MRSNPTETLVRLPNGRMEWHLADGRTAPFIFGSDGDDPAPEPQSVAEAAGTLSQVAREAAEAAPEPEVPEPAAEPVVDDIEPELLDDIDPEPGAEEPVAEAPGEDDPATADPFAELGVDRTTVEQALRLQEATKSEDGMIQLFLELSKHLGVGLDKVEALFGDPTPAPAGEEGYDPDQDPDRPLTLREFQELTAKQQADYQAAQRQQQAEQARSQAQSAVQATVTELGLTMDDDATQVILTMGNKYLPAGSLDPTAAAEAVRRGHADYLALVERERKAYVESKRKAAATVPSAPAGGAAPSTPEPAEPKDVAEAIKRARASGYSGATK